MYPLLYCQSASMYIKHSKQMHIMHERVYNTVHCTLLPTQFYKNIPLTYKCKHPQTPFVHFHLLYIIPLPQKHTHIHTHNNTNHTQVHLRVNKKSQAHKKERNKMPTKQQNVEHNATLHDTVIILYDPVP